MVTRALHDGHGTGVAYTKSLAGDAAEVGLSIDRAVHDGIADDDVLVGFGRRRRVWIHDEAASGQALADVIVGRALQLETDAAREERAEALSGGPGEGDMHCILRQPVVTVTASDDAGEHGADRAMRVANAIFETDRLAFLDRGARVRDQAMIERARESVVLLFAMVARHFWRHRRLIEHAREIESARFPVINAFAHLQQIAAPDQVAEAANPELGHELAHLFRNEEEKVDDVLGLPLEFLAQFGILSRDANGP